MQGDFWEFPLQIYSDHKFSWKKNNTRSTLSFDSEYCWLLNNVLLNHLVSAALVIWGHFY